LCEAEIDLEILSLTEMLIEGDQIPDHDDKKKKKINQHLCGRPIGKSVPGGEAMQEVPEVP
jgi:hypothetical protein